MRDVQHATATAPAHSDAPRGDGTIRGTMSDPYLVDLFVYDVIDPNAPPAPEPPAHD